MFSGASRFAFGGVARHHDILIVDQMARCREGLGQVVDRAEVGLKPGNGKAGTDDFDIGGQHTAPIVLAAAVRPARICLGGVA